MKIEFNPPVLVNRKKWESTQQELDEQSAFVDELIRRDRVMKAELKLQRRFIIIACLSIILLSFMSGMMYRVMLTRIRNLS